MNSINKFFWICSGSSYSIIKRHPTEASKYAGIGATILFTGIFAGLAAGFAIYTVFDSYWIAIVSGIFWGALIFNLDRYIVSSMRKRGSTRSELLMASPRILLAILIAIVISKPLELKIFEKEVENELVIMEQEMREAQEASIQNRFNGQIAGLTSEIEQLKAEVNTKAAERDRLSDEAIKEADGTGGTMQRNAGPIYRLKKSEADRAEQELQELKTYNDNLIVQKQAMLDTISSNIAREFESTELESYDGILARLEALNRLTNKSTTMAIANIFIILLFIAIECAPIFVKLISTKGPYDDRLQVHEHLSHNARTKGMAHENEQTRKETSELGSPEKEWVEAELVKGLR